MATASSTILSADGAHATHPCYVGKHHELHRPELHKGPVLKFNANQRYATTAPSAAAFRELGVRHGIPLQDFAVGNDTGCGYAPHLAKHTACMLSLICPAHAHHMETMHACACRCSNSSRSPLVFSFLDPEASARLVSMLARN